MLSFPTDRFDPVPAETAKGTQREGLIPTPDCKIHERFEQESLTTEKGSHISGNSLIAGHFGKYTYADLDKKIDTTFTFNKHCQPAS